MLRIETLSGDLYQNIHLYETDQKYSDIIKYIKNPTKYPKIPTYSIGISYEIAVSYDIILKNDKLIDINLDDDILFEDANMSLKIVFANLAYSCDNHIFENICTLEEEYITYITELIKIHPDQLKYVVNNDINRNLYKIAVERSGKALEYVPNELKTYELCEIAVKQNGYSLLFVPNELKTYELCEIAIKSNGIALKFIPDLSIITYDLYLLAVKSNVISFGFVPDKYKTLELCTLACLKNYCMMTYIPRELLTPEFCSMIYNKDPRAIRYIPIDK